jgi:hypothetical protein
VLYDVQANRLIFKKEDEILNLIHCNKSTPVAEIDADRVEKLAQQAKRFWMNHRQIGQDTELSRICALYLVPKEQETGLSKGSGKKNRIILKLPNRYRKKGAGDAGKPTEQSPPPVEQSRNERSNNPSHPSKSPQS